MKGLQLSFFGSASINPLDVARALVLVEMFAITFSPALVNLIELLLIVTVLGSSRLRAEIVLACKQYLPVRFLVVFIAWILVATTWGDAPAADRFHEIVSWRKLLLFPLVLALANDAFRKNMLTLISVVGVLYSIAAWVFAALGDSPSPVVLMRSDVVQTIYTALSVFAVSTLIGQYHWSKGRLLKIISIALIGVLVVTIFKLTGRSGYLFLMVGLCCFSLLIFERYRLVVVAGVSGFFLMLFLTLPGPAQEMQRGLDEIIEVTDPTKNPEFSSMGVRIVMWDHTLEMIANKPFLGSGAGSFEIDYTEVAKSRSEGWRASRSSDPHQQFLHIAAEYGIVGLAIMVVFLGSLVYRLHLNILSAFGLSVLLGFCATSFFNGHLSSLVEGRIFWILVPLFLSPNNFGLATKGVAGH